MTLDSSDMHRFDFVRMGRIIYHKKNIVYLKPNADRTGGIFGPAWMGGIIFYDKKRHRLLETQQISISSLSISYQ